MKCQSILTIQAAPLGDLSHWWVKCDDIHAWFNRNKLILKMDNRVVANILIEKTYFMPSPHARWRCWSAQVSVSKAVLPAKRLNWFNQIISLPSAIYLVLLFVHFPFRLIRGRYVTITNYKWSREYTLQLQLVVRITDQEVRVSMFRVLSFDLVRRRLSGRQGLCFDNNSPRTEILGQSTAYD